MERPGKGRYSEVRQDWQIMDKESWDWLRSPGREILVEVRSEWSWMRRAHRGWSCQRQGTERDKRGRRSATPSDSSYRRNIVRRSYNGPTAVNCCEKWESSTVTSAPPNGLWDVDGGTQSHPGTTQHPLGTRHFFHQDLTLPLLD